MSRYDEDEDLYDGEEEDYDFYEDEDEEDDDGGDHEQVVQHLRDTLSHEKALAVYRKRYEKEPKDEDELERFIDYLVTETYNAGFNEWDDDYLSYQ